MTDQSAADDDAARSRVWKLVQAIGTCMLMTSVGGLVRARPMRGIARPEHNSIWFFTDQEAEKEGEIVSNPCVCLTYSDVSDQNFVYLSGRITLVEDRAAIGGLWHQGVAVYFPKGPDDPAILLLKFEPDFGEYWDAPSSRIVLAIKFLQAKITGERPDLGDNATARLG